MKLVNNLSDEELNYYVAKAQGWILESDEAFNKGWRKPDNTKWSYYLEDYKPATSWCFCGQLLEKYVHHYNYDGNNYIEDRLELKEKYEVYAEFEDDSFSSAGVDECLKRAICKSITMAKFGNEVEING